MFISILIPLSGLWLENVYVSKEIDKKIESSLQHQAEVLSLQFDNWLDMNVRVLQQHAKTPAIQSFNEYAQKPLLKTIVESYEWSYSVFTIDAQGYIAARSDDRSTINADGTKKYFRGDREYVKEITSGHAVGQQVLLSRRLNIPALVMCVPIHKVNSASVYLGGLCMAMKLTTISSAVENLIVGETGFAMLLDDNSRVVAHGNTKVVFNELHDLKDHPVVQLAGNEKKFFYSDGDVKKVAYSKDLAQQWRLIFEQNFDDAYSESLKNQENLLYFLIATLAVSMAIAFLLAKSLSDPIKRIAAAAYAISKGQLGTKLEDVSRGDEIGDLAKAVERMAVSVKLAIKKLKEK